MAKKCSLVLVLASVLAGGVFVQAASKSKSAFRISAGGGGYFAIDFEGVHNVRLS
ncbi:MAG: hypothetical protein LBH18_03440 [Spirochaetaceae bacterium]|jgi:hypothetical protein|nr:hypothetical protein [Spirochaetaceae bacterium]